MTSKYTEKNVLQIKRDIKKASDELALINQEKEEALKGKEGLEAIRKQMADERKSHQQKIANLWLGAGEDLKLVQKTRNDLNEEIATLKTEKGLLSHQISTLSQLLRDTITKILDEKNKLTFIPSLVEEAKKMLASIWGKKTQEEAALEKIAAEKFVIERGLKELEEFEATYRAKIKKQEEVISENTERIGKLMTKLADSQEKLDEIERREHDVAVMEERLTPEYQKLYGSRKKGPINRNNNGTQN